MQLITLATAPQTPYFKRKSRSTGVMQTGTFLQKGSILLLNTQHLSKPAVIQPSTHKRIIEKPYCNLG